MSDDAAGPQREFERQPIHTEALIVQAQELGAGGRTFAGNTRNLSLGGAFIETGGENTVAVGSEVQLFIGSVRAAAALRVAATVVHVEGDGFGVRFLDADEESREYVAGFIRRFCGTGESSRGG